MKPALQLTVKQNQRLSPKLQQAIRLLHLSTAELDLEIQQILDENPILELNDDWDASYTGITPHVSQEPVHSIYTTSTLHDYLHWQLMLSPFTARDKIIATNLIDAINDDGYLDTELSEILCTLQTQYASLTPSFEADEVLMVLHRIQNFDPVGVGARNVQECMLLQIGALHLEPQLHNICATIIQQHLDAVAKKAYTDLQKSLQVDQELLHLCLQKIFSLQPKPGLVFAAHKTEYIVPDLLAQKTDDKWQVTLQQNMSSSLRISASFAQLLQRSIASPELHGLRQQYNEARWFLESLKQRNLTLLKVANCIMQQQKDFLEHGATHMRPLILQDVAYAVNLSESTISRISNRKYIHTPRGIFELKYFFNAGMQTASGNLCSGTAIKAMLKELIANEDPSKRLSDQALTELISQQGICIARRTVTKYREALGILASNQRGT